MVLAVVSLEITSFIFCAEWGLDIVSVINHDLKNRSKKAKEIVENDCVFFSFSCILSNVSFI